MSNGLGDVLGIHIAGFRTIHRIEPSAFEIIQGDSCLRVCVYNSHNPNMFNDSRYIPSDFGFESICDLSIAVDHILRRAYSLKQIRKPVSI